MRSAINLDKISVQTDFTRTTNENQDNPVIPGRLVTLSRSMQKAFNQNTWQNANTPRTSDDKMSLNQSDDNDDEDDEIAATL